MENNQNGVFLSFVILALLMTWISNYVIVQSTSGQMMVGPNMMNKNMSKLMESRILSIMKGDNITGSINMMSTISKAIASEVKVSLSEAAVSAEKSVGNDSHALAAHINIDNGYLVYNVAVVDSNGKAHKVIIDPANGKILLSRELSEFESVMILHQGMMMGGQGFMGGGMMDRGFMGGGMMDRGFMGGGMMDRGFTGSGDGW
jgi:uncharacterized membrane protein YkoI